MYLILKHTHMTMVGLTFILFTLRFWWMWRDSPYLTHKVSRILPHLVDTLLLASAILLTLQIQQYPFVNDWLTYKVLGLVAYIIFGTIALKRGRTKTIRLWAGAAAYVSFFMIVKVAVAKQLF